MKKFYNFKINNKIAYIFIALILVFIYWLFSVTGIEWLERLELVTFNFRMKLRGPIDHSDKVKIVSIDDRSLHKLYYDDNNPWPWSRDVYANIINKLSEAGTKSIVMDISFSTLDPDNKDKDLKFAETLFDNQLVTIGTTLINSKREYEKLDQEYRKILSSEDDYFDFRYKISNPNNYYFPEFFSTYKLVPPADLFKNSVWAYGTFEIGLPSPDGIYHHIPLVINEKFQNEKGEVSLFLLPNLDILGLSAYYDIEPGDYILDLEKNRIKLGDKNIPVDRNGYFTLNYYGKRAFSETSVIEVLNMNKEEVEKHFQDKLVLLGYTAQAKGIFDARPTPFNKNESGIQLHATAIQNIIDNNYLRRVPLWVNVIVLFILLLTSFLFLSINRLNYSIILDILLILCYNFSNYLLFKFNLWLDLFYPNLVLIIILLYTTILKVYKENEEKLRIKGYFSRYVPPDVVNNILENPLSISPGGEKKEITVLFSDIVDFTGKAESMEAEELVRLLNEYFAEMTEIIKNQYGGTLDKYIGDSILAIYGAPFSRKDDPLRAVNTALAMIEKQKELQEKWRNRGEDIVFKMGIGINTGEAVVGNIGSPERVNYTCIGDTVNIAARLEKATREFDTNILISSSTYQQVKEYFKCEKILDLKIKGKAEFMTVYDVLKRRDSDEN